MTVPPVIATPGSLPSPSLPDVQAAVPTADQAAAPPPVPPSPQALAVTSAVQSAAARQGGLDQLIADLTVALESPELPQPIQAAAAQLLALQTPAEPPPGAADLQQAMVQSGLLMEASLAAGQASPDIKAALLMLARALKTWIAAAPRDDNPPPAKPSAPPPPYRGAQTAAQPPPAPSQPAGAGAGALVRALLQQTSGAIARQELLQAASLPGDAEGQGWMFETPILTPQGTAVAQFRISRDKSKVGAGREAPEVWRAGFSIALEPLGPVHAQLVLTGARAGVTLWAEREATALELRQGQPRLAAALGGAGLQADVSVQAGSPRRPAPAPGRLVDQAT